MKSEKRGGRNVRENNCSQSSRRNQKAQYRNFKNTKTHAGLISYLSLRTRTV